MKIKYVIAVLTLLGLDVVSTLASSQGDLTFSSGAGLVQVTQGETSKHLDTVNVNPYQGSDGIYIKISLKTASSSITLDLTLEDLSNPIDTSGSTFSYKTDGG